jgi:hypothetical protein
VLLLYFLVIGLVAGFLAGGRLEGLERVRFRWWPLALGGLGFQALLFSDVLGPNVGDAGPALYVASSGLVLMAAVRNLAQPGFRLLTLGAGLNLVVVVANGGRMPSSPEARLALNGTLELGHTTFSNSTLANAGTLLPMLGDIFVLPRPIPFANVFSIGDVLIGIGAVVLIVRAMRSAPPLALAGPR